MQAVGKEICLGIVSTKDATYQKFCKWMLKKGRVYRKTFGARCCGTPKPKRRNNYLVLVEAS